MQPLDTYSGPTSAHFDGKERRSFMSVAHRALISEYIHAWQAGPDTVIRTPAFFDKPSGLGKATMPLSNVVAEDIGGAPLERVMLILRDGADGHDVAMRCAALIAELASIFAKYHAEALAIELAGDDSERE